LSDLAEFYTFVLSLTSTNAQGTPVSLSAPITISAAALVWSLTVLPIFVRERDTTPFERTRPFLARSTRYAVQNAAKLDLCGWYVRGVLGERLLASVLECDLVAYWNVCTNELEFLSRQQSLVRSKRGSLERQIVK
jgi:hypothetical protein